uniref:Uncharacterized protein n=3 Tax=Oryza TaxID=4527 RepID=A0A0D3F186_9ORYZ
MEKWPLACTTTTDNIAAVGKGEGRRETKTVARGVCNMVVTSIHTWSLSYLSHLVVINHVAVCQFLPGAGKRLKMIPVLCLLVQNLSSTADDQSEF